MKVLKKCIIALLCLLLIVTINPTSVFAAESAVSDTIIAPRLIHVDTNIVLRNGDTAYFNNPSTSLPFVLREGQSFNFIYGANKQHSNVEVGLLDENNNIVDSVFFKDGSSLGYGIGTSIRKTGKYRCFVTNYGLSDITITYARFN